MRKYRKYVFLFVMFVFIHSLQYFDLVGINPTHYGRFTYFVDALIIGAIILFGKKDDYMYSSPFLIMLLTVPVLSFIPCFIENGQSPVESVKVYSSCTLVLVYYLLHYARIRESELVRAITILALARIAILVIQQFTYPFYLFAFRAEGYDEVSGLFREIEIRSGIRRFYIEDTYLSMFLVFYYFDKMLRKLSPKYIALFIIGIIGVYLDQSRQFMISTAAALVLVPLLSSGKKRKIVASVLVIGIIVFFIPVASRLFGELFTMTAEDLTEDNIRVLAYSTFLFDTWGGPLSIMFGNGPAGHSAYGDMIAGLATEMRLHLSDIGIVGALSEYGITGVIALLGFFVRFFSKYGSKLSVHIKMYLVAMIVNLPLVTIYTQRINWFVFMSLMLYLSDLSILSNVRKHKI